MPLALKSFAHNCKPATEKYPEIPEIRDDNFKDTLWSFRQ